MNASEIMTAPVISVHPGTSIHDALRQLLEHRVSSLPVVDARNRLVGTVTETDLLRARVMRQSLDADGATRPLRRCPTVVADVLHGEIPWVDASDPLEVCIQLMLRYEGRSVPVVRHGHVVGMISRRDLVRANAHPAFKPVAPPETLVDDDELRRQHWVQVAS